jgi:hypothetical protein
MKKLVIIFGVLIAGSPFVSCKKLKDDIKDLQHKNSQLQEQLNGVMNTLGSDEPISATTTFEDNNGKTRTVTGLYRLKSADYSTQKMVKNNDGTYEIYVERIGDISWNEGAWASFTYNPTSKAVTDVSGGQYWNDADSYYDNANYSNSYSGATINLTVDSLNIETGATSLKFSASATATYTNSAPYYYVPNQGKPVSTNLTFVGKLKLFTQD